MIAAALTLVAVPTTSAQFGRNKPKAKLKLAASVDAVVPGKAFDVGIQFRLPSGWHIYWINQGESGLPPRVKWNLPDGLDAGAVQFPIPKRHTDRAGIVTNIHEHKPVLIAQMTPADSLSGSKVTIKADVAYLICKSTCLRETAELKLELPVRSDGEAKPANEDLFKAARRRLPKDTSKVLTVTPSVSTSDFAVDTKFELRLAIEVGKKFHIQSHKPLTEGFVPLDVFIEPASSIMFSEAVYPEPHVRKIPVLGKISEYSGKITVTVPAEVDEQPPPGPLRIAGIVTYQGCNEKGTCFPPDAIRFSLDARTAAAAPPIKDVPPPADAPKAAPATTAREPKTHAAAPKEDVEEKAAAAPVKSESTSDADEDGLEAFLVSLGLPGLLATCFLYGLFINATPCVLPLLSIKVLGFVQQAHESRGRTLMLGLSFGAGVMIFFVVLGLLASRGTNILQIPEAVIALGAVVMALSLSMLGVYTLQVPTTATNLEAKIQKEGMAASFGKGALAPVLGFACTGPLLAGAFGWATLQPPSIAMLAFVVMGLGMASPYMLLGANPNWLGFLPRPGNWMITFERIMGFLLLAMVIWLLNPLVTQIGATGLQWTFAFLVAVAMACWVLGKVNVSMPTAQRLRYRGGAAAIVLIVGGLIYGMIYPIGQAQALIADAGADGVRTRSWSDGEIPWQKWSAQNVRQAVLAGKPVFVDFTAAYCTVCKANKKIATNTAESRAKMEACGFEVYKGDFSNSDDAIFAELQKHGRGGVPLNLIFRPGQPDDPIVLRPSLTKAYLLDKLNAACADGDTARTASRKKPTGN